VRVEGTLAARGSVRIGGPIVTGTLGGDRVRVQLAKVRLATAGTLSLQSAPLSLDFPLPGLARER
jgi:hypothetical protein